MTVFVMVACLMDRQAISMRSVALAATILLILRPEYLVTPSFQLSFSAVIGLIAFYESYKNPVRHWLARGGWWRWLLIYMAGLLLTSCVATLATLPFTILHFNRFTLHVVLSNLVAVPWTSFVVMPLALLSTLSLSWGGSETTFDIYGRSIAVLMDLADTVSQWPGADVRVATPPQLAVVLFIAGVLWLVVWRKAWRYAGLVPMVLAVGLTVFQKLPHVLIDEKLVAYRQEDSRELWLSSTRKGKFTARQWEGQVGASASHKMPCDDCVMPVNDYGVLITEQSLNHCPQEADFILSHAHQPCHERQVDLKALQEKGSHALWLTPQGIEMQHSKVQERPWTLKVKNRRQTRSP